MDELAYLFVEQIDPALRAKVLLFDWWVCNGDRTLTEDGGNVNLLWTHRDHRLNVIDHNLAFDDEAASGFWEQHVFRESRQYWNSGFRSEMTSVMRTINKEVPGDWKEMPEAWHEGGAGPKFEEVQRILARFETDSELFWEGR